MDFVQLCRVIIGSVVMVKVVHGQVQKSPELPCLQVHCLGTKWLTNLSQIHVELLRRHMIIKNIEKPELVDLLKKD